MFRNKANIIEYIGGFDDIFDYARSNKSISIFNKIQNTQNLGIRLNKLR